MDYVAVTTARMKGGANCSFGDGTFYHNRMRGSESPGFLKFHRGKQFARLKQSLLGRFGLGR